MMRTIQTKQKLATTFKNLLSDHKFSDLTVCLICTEAKISRKIFYKYFKDKYDLIYFIFEMEFLSCNSPTEGSFVKFYYNAVDYFYQNRKLYKKLFALIEQNSFSETFHTLIKNWLKLNKSFSYFNDESDKEFALSFFADALTISLRKWIVLDEPELPQVYFQRLKKLFSPFTNISVSALKATL